LQEAIFNKIDSKSAHLKDPQAAATGPVKERQTNSETGAKHATSKACAQQDC